MDEQIKWSNLSRQASADKLAEKGIKVSVTVVDQLLAKHDFRRRQAFKSVAGKQVAQQDEQFKNIEQIIESAKAAGNPVMSMDVKKRVDREFLPSGQIIHTGAQGDCILQKFKPIATN